jgi:hypothetical protein
MKRMKKLTRYFSNTELRISLLVVKKKSYVLHENETYQQ